MIDIISSFGRVPPSIFNEPLEGVVQFHMELSLCILRVQRK